MRGRRHEKERQKEAEQRMEGRKKRDERLERTVRVAQQLAYTHTNIGEEEEEHSDG